MNIEFALTTNGLTMTDTTTLPQWTHSPPATLTYPKGLPENVAPLAEQADTVVRSISTVTAAAAFVLFLGLFVDGRQFFHSYLFGYVFALDIALGALFWNLIHHVSDAGWSVGLRRIYENIHRTILPLAILFLPILFGIFRGQLHQWYVFIHSPQPADEHLQHIWHVKGTYFSTPFFLMRIVIYFTIWLSFSLLMRYWSVQQDYQGGAILTLRMQRWAPLGLVLLGLSSTFFAFDLLMSLQYTWFSTIYGVYFWVGGFRGSLALVVLIVAALHLSGRLRQTITIEHLHDTGQLMFGLTVFWAYIAFAQYFLIWYGNMPEETQFYLLRRNGTWYVATLLLPILYFIVPFFMLLPQAHKRSLRWLCASAILILLMHAYDLYWQILPVLHPSNVNLHWLDVAALITFTGIVLLATLWGLQRLPLIPIRDARLSETIGYVNHTP
jgi:hypothetical protein